MVHVGKTLMEKIEDKAYAEAFDGIYSRILVTAERGVTEEDTNSPLIEFDPLRCAAYRATATPSTVVGRLEAGIERWLPKERTPDRRDGVVIQYWGMFDQNKSLEEQAKKFFREMSIRIRQDILSVSGGTARVFNYMRLGDSIHVIDTEERVGRCGRGHETFLEEYERGVISVPLMSGFDFKIDKTLGLGLGVSGANFWIMSDNYQTGRIAGNAAVRAIQSVEGVIMPFYSCPSGSSAENYEPVGPATNYEYCPTLKNKIPNSKVPDGINSIPEIVIDGVDITSVKNAMREGILAALDVDGVKKISAGNYGGKLGPHQIGLRDLFA